GYLQNPGSRKISRNRAGSTGATDACFVI
ncbi:MAG: hypothetical protein QG671_2955, partial [Actinomycetota bacterium]|nr:hypothetical protein [Actinomycetota bacterium]